jgi:hypothetical protein
MIISSFSFYILFFHIYIYEENAIIDNIYKLNNYNQEFHMGVKRNIIAIICFHFV